MRALITGATGQDGSYLADLLLEKGYEVHGLVRRSSRPLPAYLDPRVVIRYGDLSDQSSLDAAVLGANEVYHLAAQSDVGASFEVPVYTGDIDALGTLRLLESIVRHNPDARFYQAGTSEMFGSSPAPQNEDTPFRPRSPYAIAKVFAHHAVVHYREAYGIHASNGILFNHESPRRGEMFVTRKVTKAVARIKAGSRLPLLLGNLDALRDWGYAPEFVEGIWRIMQHPEPGDYVLATGEQHSVRELCETAFGMAGLDWEKHVRHDPRLSRPLDVENLLGDASKAERVLGWRAETRFRDLVRLMLEADLCPT